MISPSAISLTEPLQHLAIPDPKYLRYPFLLPNIIGAFLAALTLPVLLFWYPETKGLDERRGDGEFKR